MQFSKLNVALIVSCLLFCYSCNSTPVVDPSESNFFQDADSTPRTFDSFGFESGSFEIDIRMIRPNENLASIFSQLGYSQDMVNSAMSRARGVLDLRRVVAGKPLLLYYKSLDDNVPSHVIYQQNLSEFIIFDMDGDIKVRAGSKEVTRQTRSAEGVIDGSLYMTLVNQGVTPTLATELSEVFAWQIDFYRIQRGDSFRVIFEENVIDGVSTSIHRINAAYFRHAGREFYAIYFEQDGRGDYYDLEGESMRKAFLRAPLEYTRISSRFTNRRFHPILQRNIPHHGTDYAAPAGTPIRAVGDGVILRAAYDNANGNYVRIRHNGTYETGYLHMSRIANGVRVGSSVKQGQIIGYVGSTGLATGPHLCYRFWVNGQPADPHRIDFPSSHPVLVENKKAYNVYRTQMFAALSRPNSADKPGAWSIVAIGEITAQIPEKPLILSMNSSTETR
jgi:murein DD-endopeptidase MepM/ murein hydrolase activator NlpD